MDESYRLREPNSYRIMDTLPERELDELAEIASAICDTPISLVTFVDGDRQWFKAAKGLGVPQTPRADAFCQHALWSPGEVMVVEDSLADERFRDNPLVQGDPRIRFYAGAPLETPQGYVLGTLCVIDSKPRTISEAQKNALRLLAGKAMEHLEIRKRLMEQGERMESSAARLKQLTDLAPGAIFQLEQSLDGRMSFPFISEGMTRIHPTLSTAELQENAAIAFTVVHPDDLERVKESLSSSYLNLTDWSVEYRVLSEDGGVCWHWANARTERREDGTVVWYGNFQDITERKGYIKTLEQIVFDISHVMRRPVANMLGLAEALERDDMDEKKLKVFTGLLKRVSGEMDECIRKLNNDYSETRSRFTGTLNPA